MTSLTDLEITIDTTTQEINFSYKRVYTIPYNITFISK